MAIFNSYIKLPEGTPPLSRGISDRSLLESILLAASGTIDTLSDVTGETATAEPVPAGGDVRRAGVLYVAQHQKMRPWRC